MQNFQSKLSENGNIIHSTAIIDKSVVLGSNNYIGPYCVITGEVTIGNNNRFESHVSIGAMAQHRDHKTRVRGVIIGNDNVFREFVTVHSGIHTYTSIGNQCYLMNYVHIPHDCVIGNVVTISNNVQIAGHVTISDFCNIGLSAVIHQFSYLGQGAMLGMGCVVPKKKRILPYKTYIGAPCRELKDNEVLIKRQNIDEKRLAELRKDYNSAFTELFLK